ncbi:hypothetical protein [Agrococcus sp. KRD186]|jgi:hypothetical protein|uniref:hypothetical protein n=1 Tax=Agrococcus sp. KRD186 TaxID=2729730 RepID=UPI0019D0536E|nr:hypothetical protein [Agrococcus sp. KRD186]
MTTTPVTFPIDQARVADAGRAHRALLAWQIALALAAAVGIVLAQVWQLHLLTTILAGLLLVLAVVSVVLSVRRWRAVQSLVGDGRGIALAIDDHGIVLAGVPSVPWSEILAVATVDDRARTQRVSRIPLTGIFVRMAVRAGSSVLGACVVVRDGEAMRAACSSDAERARIEVWKPHPSDGKPHGAIILLLDAVMSEGAALEAGRALVAAARARGIDAEPFVKQLEFMEFYGSRVDPKWH